ncbi:MAG: dihydroorotate dehydrogenase electron transfer subunit [Nitrospiraceae bacterium]|nr:MAG: dihydroorotate dehydrogenase electron transfer subunit [Nitrospiraceae bacterium]
MNRLFRASIVENRQIIPDHFLLTLRPLIKIPTPKPGNFFMLSVDHGMDPLLKRPFSIHRLFGDDVQILYRLAGKGTHILSGRNKGDILDAVGPLGNKFPPPGSGDKTILIAGGIGIAPIFALAEKLKNKEILLFYGAKTKEELLCTDQIKSLGIDPVISTDDGSCGQKGTAIDALIKHLIRHPSLVTSHRLYACGPRPMFKSLSLLAKKHNLKGYIALEQHMACGIGTCLGCVINTVDGYKRVCREGPVFPLEKILWE